MARRSRPAHADKGIDDHLGSETRCRYVQDWRTSLRAVASQQLDCARLGARLRAHSRQMRESKEMSLPYLYNSPGAFELLPLQGES